MTPSLTTRARRFRSLTSWSWLAVATVSLVGAVAAGCNSETASSSCTAGEISSCVGPQGCSGQQVCADDGSSLGECSCDDTLALTGDGGAGGSSMTSDASSMGGGAMVDTMSAGGGATMGAGGGSMSSGVTRSMGAHCQADGDCVDGLFCVTEDMPGVIAESGPAQGYCSATCNAQAECRELDSLSVCRRIDSDAPGYCYAACVRGAPDIATKCVGAAGYRLQVCATLPVAFDDQGRIVPADICIPRCSADSDCSEGRVCDLGVAGGCIDERPEGGSTGAFCTEDVDCSSGTCLDLPNSVQECGGYCTYGPVQGCGFEEETTEVRTEACLNTVTGGDQPGDLGSCFELCDVAEDCLQDGASCSLLPDSNVVRLGRQGFCENVAAGD